jgi:hypothetical protein
MKKNKKDEERDLNWEYFVSTIILVPHAISSIWSIMPPHNADVCPKKVRSAFLLT